MAGLFPVNPPNFQRNTFVDLSEENFRRDVDLFGVDTLVERGKTTEISKCPRLFWALFCEIASERTGCPGIVFSREGKYTLILSGSRNHLRQIEETVDTFRRFFLKIPNKGSRFEALLIETDAGIRLREKHNEMHSLDPEDSAIIPSLYEKIIEPVLQELCLQVGFDCSRDVTPVTSIDATSRSERIVMTLRIQKFE